MSFRFLILILFYASQLSFAQNKKDYKQTALAEKIYLQLDHEIYTTDKTIWFKAIIVNAATHSTDLSSGVLYVDLINPKNKILESKIIKVRQGIAKGYFDLNRNYINGTYQIRAYTEWNKNFDGDFETKKTIRIISINTDNASDLQANIMNTSLGAKVKNDSIILNFFPEGGKLIANLENKVGFKATDISGKSIDVEGEIINKRGKTIATFKSNRLGLGSFIIPNALASETYKAKIYNDKNVRLYRLPKIYENGYSLSVVAHQNFIVATVNHNKDLTSKIKLSVTLRGKIYYEKEVSLIDGRYIFTLPKTLFPEGVLEITLRNQFSVPVAERLFFNKRKSYRLNMDAVIINNNLSIRDEVLIRLKAKNHKDSIVEANSSVLVLDKNLYGQFEAKRENILTYFLLSSDIKGNIEEASTYFNDSTDLNIDYLMLTQGWRNYKYVEKPKKLKYIMESKLQIKGVINKKNKKAKFSNLDVLLMTFGDDSSIYTGKVNVPSNFHFQIDDLFGGERKLILKPSGISEKESSYYNISLTKKAKLKPNFVVNETKNSFEKKDSLIATIAKINTIHKSIINQYYTDLTGINQLDEVIVDAYKMTPKRKEMFEKYGKPDVVIDGKDINTKTTKYSRGLYSNLIAFQDKVFIRKDSLRNYYAETLNGGKGHVNIVLVDGVAVNPSDYLLIQKINPKEVTSFEIIDNPSRARQLYATIYGTYPYGDFQASIISIYTKQEKGLFGALDTKAGLNVQTVDVFSIEKEFYIPGYSDNMAINFHEPDFRSTIYWNPNMINEIGESLNINYSHSDNVGEFLVVIESITKDGKLGYKTLEYKVTETQD